MSPEQPVDPIAGFIGFTRALRAAGVQTQPAKDFIEAVGRLDVGREDDVYWAGRATLCDEPDDIPTYDRVFRQWFAPGRDGAGQVPTTSIQRSTADHRGDDESGAGSSDASEDVVAAIASPVEHL